MKKKKFIETDLKPFSLKQIFKKLFTDKIVDNAELETTISEALNDFNNTTMTL